MRRVVLLSDAVEDLERARRFYEDQAPGIGDYFVTSLLADLKSLSLHHGIHKRQYDCYRMLATRFPFGIYYLESETETQVIAILDLRRKPSWIRQQVSRRQD